MNRLRDQIAKILFEHDPMQIAATTDEYNYEARLLAPRLSEDSSLGDVENVLWEVMRDAFAPARVDRDKLTPVARDIWSALHSPDVGHVV